MAWRSTRGPPCWTRWAVQKEGCLETYDQEFAGRNRRYYRLTETGAETLARLRADWVEYRDKIDAILLDEGDAQ